MADKFMMTVGKKLFEANMENYTPKDPLYEEYVDSKGKKKRRRVGKDFLGDLSSSLTFGFTLTIARAPTGFIASR